MEKPAIITKGQLQSAWVRGYICIPELDLFDLLGVTTPIGATLGLSQHMYNGIY